MAPLLRAERLSIGFGGGDVVHDVSLQLEAGEVVALLGPNGAGKSTLLGGLSGSLQASSGSVERSGRIAVALQSPDLARRSVQANVELALAWWGVPRAQRRERAAAALRDLRIDGLAARQADSLSGGERRRAHLARALAVSPDVLMLDEPFAGLDNESRARLLEDSATALRAPDRATLVVVHDRAEAWAIADRLLVLMDGRMVAQGTPRSVLEAPPSIEVARFVGYDGTVRNGAGESLLTRPAHVVLDPAGDTRGVVSRLVPIEDGVRVELSLGDRGTVYALTGWPGPEVGERVSVRITGGVRFPGRPD